jgi:hypothetical protein
LIYFYLPLQPTVVGSPAPAQGHVTIAREDMVAQGGVGGKPKSDLIMTHTRL